VGKATPSPPTDPSGNADLAKTLERARAALAQNPGDAQAKSVVLSLEAALVVEQRIKTAREALRRGDKEAALTEIKLGFAVNPKEPRLLDLFREATR
jgi:hypothetical protein